MPFPDTVFSMLSTSNILCLAWLIYKSNLGDFINQISGGTSPAPAETGGDLLEQHCGERPGGAGDMELPLSQQSVLGVLGTRSCP